MMSYKYLLDWTYLFKIIIVAPFYLPDFVSNIVELQLVPSWVIIIPHKSFEAAEQVLQQKSNFQFPSLENTPV